MALLSLIAADVSLGDQQLKAVKVDLAPVIDGDPNDAQWQTATEIVT